MTRRYFTLMEVVIASLILAGMAAALFAFSSHTMSSWQSLQVRRNQLSELMVVDRALEAMLPNIIPFNWPDPEKDTLTETPVLVAESQSLRCAYLHRLNDLEEGAIRFCELFVEDGKLIMKYSDRPFIIWEDAGERVWTSTIAEEIESVEFSYADWDAEVTEDNWAEGLVWTDSFDNVETERYDVPLAIKVTVHWLDGRGYTWLRRTMGNGYRERFGKWEAQELND